MAKSIVVGFFGLALALLSTTTAADPPCVLETHSTLSCLDAGDYGNLSDRLCKICNVYITPKGQFLVLPRPDDRALGAKWLYYYWKPATAFAKYDVAVNRVSSLPVDVSSVQNTTLYVAPRFEVPLP